MFDGAGLIPVFGQVFDGINAVIYGLRGQYGNAALSSAAMLPVIGWGSTAAKTVQKTSKFDGLLKQASNLFPNKAGKIELHHITQNI